MAFQPVPNVAQIRIEGVADNQLTINDQYWEISGGGINATNLAALAVALVSWVTGSLCPLLSEQWTATRIVGIDLTSAIGPTTTQNVSTAGGVSGEAAPNNVSACVSLRTASRGRSFRGRNFLPGIPNSLITTNTLDSTFITDVLSAYSELVGPGTFLAGWQYGIVSRVTGGVPRASGLFVPIESVIMVGTAVRSMRSREIGHGA